MNRFVGITLIGFCLAGVFGFSGRGKADDNSKPSSINIKQEARKLLRAADADYRQGEADRALVLLDSIFAMDPSNADGYYLKARIELFKGDSAAAIETLNEASLKAPRSTRIKLLLARVHLKNGRFEEPLAIIESVLAIKPFDSESLYLRGWGLLLSGDTVQAAEVLEKVLDKKLGEGR